MKWAKEHRDDCWQAASVRMPWKMKGNVKVGTTGSYTTRARGRRGKGKGAWLPM